MKEEPITCTVPVYKLQLTAAAMPMIGLTERALQLGGHPGRIAGGGEL